MAYETLSFSVVFIAGILSFLSPCILPLIPVYLSYIGGMNIKEAGNRRFKIFINTIFFVLGLGTIFIILQILFIYFANFGAKIISNGIIFKIAGIIIIMMALHILGVFKLKMFNYQKSFNLKIKGDNIFTAYLIGFLFGLGWSPCMGPLLFAVVSYSSKADTVLLGVFYMLVYILGLGLPFLIFSLFISIGQKFIRKIVVYSRKIEIVSGILLLIMGIVLFMDKLSILSSF